jgi:hypothetical protein
MPFWMCESDAAFGLRADLGHMKAVDEGILFESRWKAQV